MRKRCITLASVLSILAVGAIPLQASTIFVNGEVPINTTTTPFDDTVNGITAHFTSSPSAGAFEAQSTSGTVSWGTEMWFENDLSDSSLRIVFSQVLSSVTMDFGTLDVFSPTTIDPFVLTAYLGGLGGSQVGSTQQSGTFVDTMAEGSITFNAANFDTLVLSSVSPTIAVGDITVTADGGSGVPEPSTAVLLGAGILLLLLGGARWSPIRALHRA